MIILVSISKTKITDAVFFPEAFQQKGSKSMALVSMFFRICPPKIVCSLGWYYFLYFVIPVVFCALQVNLDLFCSVIYDFVFMVNHYKPPFGKMFVCLLQAFSTKPSKNMNMYSQCVHQISYQRFLFFVVYFGGRIGFSSQGEKKAPNFSGMDIQNRSNLPNI